MRQTRSIEALDRSKDVLEGTGTLSAHPQFPKDWVSQGLAKSRPALRQPNVLLEDVLSVGTKRLPAKH